MKEGIIILPEIYSRLLKEVPDDVGMPKDALMYVMRTECANAILSIWEVDEKASMRFGDPQSVVDYLHGCMQENEGIVEVACGTSTQGKEIIYDILKYRLQYKDGLKYNAYCLNMNIKADSDIYFINASYSEEGTTGMRDSAVFELYKRDHPDLEDPFQGWSFDPYNEQYRYGFLMNQSERKVFDQYFPEHPLTKMRELIDFIVQNN